MQLRFYSNVVELRSDLMKISGYQRHFSRNVRSIGTWSNVLLALSNIAVVTNFSFFLCYLLYYPHTLRDEPIVPVDADAASLDLFNFNTTTPLMTNGTLADGSALPSSLLDASTDESTSLLGSLFMMLFSLVVALLRVTVLPVLQMLNPLYLLSLLGSHVIIPLTTMALPTGALDAAATFVATHMHTRIWEWSTFAQVTLIIVGEHCVLGMKFLVAALIPEKTQKVRIAYAKKVIVQRQLLSQLADVVGDRPDLLPALRPSSHHHDEATEALGVSVADFADPTAKHDVSEKAQDQVGAMLRMAVMVLFSECSS
jgi:hypothetical protein